MAYILMVVMTVASGSNIRFQEFSNEARCRAMMNHIISEDKRVGFYGNLESIACLPK